MKLTTKIQLANFSLKLLLVAAGIFLFGLVVLIFFIIFHRYISNDFGQALLFILFASGSAAIISGILYIGLSLNIPPEHRFRDSETVQSKSKGLKRVLIVIVVSAVAASATTVGYKCLSENRERAKVENKIDMVVDRYDSFIEELPLLYSDTARAVTIFDKIALMANQGGLSGINLIFMADINDLPSFINIGGSDYYETIPVTGFNDYTYQCTTDCEYLTDIFNGGEMKFFELYEDNYWYFYRPFESHGQRFVLMFSGY